MKLCIISHTEHYLSENNQILGWGTTVTEINNLTSIFDEIYHVAMLHDGIVPASSLPYTSDKIKLIQIPALGGKTFSSKVEILKNIPKVINTVRATLEKVDCFQFRGPTGIGVFLIPYLILFSKKKGWFKYAGNWNQKNAPLGYALQRFLLKNQKRIVTINGKWPNQPKQCLTFENPTLINENVIEGIKIIENKDYSGRINFCFVGRLEREKGVERILKSFQNLEEISRVGIMHLVGEGFEVDYFKELAAKCDIDVVFHGALPRDKVFDIYKKSHVFLLPSTASEGFPKVIAEALCFGCIPLVSDVSSITQYIKQEQNGFIVSPVTNENLTLELKNMLNLSTQDFKALAIENDTLIKKFTFEYYNHRIKNDVINSFK